MSNVKCQRSNVKCQMLNVKCQMSNVKYPMSNVKCHIISMTNVKCHGMSRNVNYVVLLSDCVDYASASIVY